MSGPAGPSGGCARELLLMVALAACTFGALVVLVELGR
jgi:hypothetical protein